MSLNPKHVLPEALYEFLSHSFSLTPSTLIFVEDELSLCWIMIDTGLPEIIGTRAGSAAADGCARIRAWHIQTIT